MRRLWWLALPLVLCACGTVGGHVKGEFEVRSPPAPSQSEQIS